MAEREQAGAPEAAEPAAAPAVAPVPRGLPASVLALQRSAGNRAVAGILRQGYPHPMAQYQQLQDFLGLRPPRGEFEVHQAAKKLLTRGALDWAITDENAVKALDLVAWSVSGEEQRNVVKKLDDEGLIDVLFEELPNADRQSTRFVRILGMRDPARNKGLAQKLMSYHLFDWQISDEEAKAAAELLEVLPEEERFALEKSWFGERMRLNLPGSPDYERDRGREILAGAVMGDFNEDPTGWNIVGQILVGFVPYAGQAADVRDTVAACKELDKDYTSLWSWGNLVLTLIAWVPGLGDAVKWLGKGVMRWMRSAGMKLIGGVVDQLAKHVVQPAIENLVKPAIRKLREGAGELFEEFRKRYKPDGGTVAKEASEVAAEVLAKQADEAVEGAVSGARRGTDEVVQGVADALILQLKEWATKVFKKDAKLGAIWPAIEGDDLVIYGEGSKVRLVRVRIKQVHKEVVAKTQALLQLATDRAKRLAAARAAPTEAIENLERRAAIVITEEIGERVARILVEKHWPGAVEVFRGSGSGVVDLVFEHAGKLIVVEAKGGASRLGYREIGPGVMAQQGTLTYLDDIIKSMKAKGGTIAQMADKLKAARAQKGGLLYVISKSGRIDDTTDPLASALAFIVQ